MTLAMKWAVQGLVVPHIGRTIDSTVEAINAGLQSLKAGTGTLGKVAVIVDRELVEEVEVCPRARGWRRAAPADEDRAGCPAAETLVPGSSPPGRSGIGRRHELFIREHADVFQSLKPSPHFCNS
jgi:hypothetical protein